ncbi:hypothetical protein C8R44DRAFT_989654 [Mycena epipterygia]|nr:hypothetical protein C8R44DRAFT_989654 [Mycena epipterygia]
MAAAIAFVETTTGIRTLHSYLPPPPPAPGPYPPPPTDPVASSSAPAPSSYVGSDPEERDAEPEGNTEGDTEEPPKKKRRRQALSCTECKRRNIWCDRSVLFCASGLKGGADEGNRKQPCEPCAKRGDTDKRQWHVVEPAIEKYIPHAEHDALLARVAARETYLQCVPPPVLGALPAFSPTYGSSSNNGHGNASPPGFISTPPTPRRRYHPCVPAAADVVPANAGVDLNVTNAAPARPATHEL